MFRKEKEQNKKNINVSDTLKKDIKETFEIGNKETMNFVLKFLME